MRMSCELRTTLVTLMASGVAGVSTLDAQGITTGVFFSRQGPG